jgi:hypothetical protein
LGLSRALRTPYLYRACAAYTRPRHHRHQQERPARQARRSLRSGVALAQLAGDKVEASESPRDDSRTSARLSVEAVELTKSRFDEVDPGFATDEGEGDQTLAYWQEAHRRYFTRRGEFAPDMELWRERLALVARL